MFSRRSQGSEPHIGLPSPGVLHWGDEPAEHLALKARRAYFQEGQRAAGNRDFTLKRSSHALRPRAEAVI